MTGLGDEEGGGLGQGGELFITVSPSLTPARQLNH